MSRMTATADSSFIPPTEEQVRRHLDRYTPQERSRLQVWAPLIGLGLVLGAALALAGTAGELLPWLLLIALFFSFGLRDRRMRALEQRVNQVYELTVLRHTTRALRLAWRILPSVRSVPGLYGRTVALLAHNLDMLRCYEAAIAGYDRLLDHLPGQHPWAIQLSIQRTIAQLNSDQLTSGDESLRRLRSMAGTISDGATRAALRLAGLVQQAKTYHWADAVEGTDRLVEELRPLGVEAGYGYALVALAFHHMGERREEAQTWWRRATLLLSPDVLVDRFPALAVAVANLPARPQPELESS